MNRFQNFETSALIEMLARHTSQLTSMLVKTVTSKEYEDCKKIIEELQIEINVRTYPNFSDHTPSESHFRHE